MYTYIKQLFHHKHKKSNYVKYVCVEVRDGGLCLISYLDICAVKIFLKSAYIV